MGLPERADTFGAALAPPPKMSFPDLRAFLDRLRRDRDLAVISVPVERSLEAAEVHRRVVAAGGPALLFTNVADADFPVVTNLFGTARRAELAFGERPGRLIRRLAELPETLMPPTPSRLWGARDVGAELLRIGLRRGRRGPVTEVVTSDVRLDRLPALTTWPDDGGPFITLPTVFTEHPDGHGHNLGMYRLQIHDARTTRVDAAWTSAAGSKRVNVVHRKFMALRAARSASSVRTTSGHRRNAGCDAARAGRSGSSAAETPPATRQPRQNTRTRSMPAGSSAAENSPGSSRTGSPSPSHTPFEPWLTAGPV